MSASTTERTAAPEGWPLEAREYVSAVDDALTGVDPDERHDLLEDLRAHVDALLEDEGHEVDLTARLGTPSAYASELVESAGLAAPASSPGRLSTLYGRIRAAPARARAMGVDGRTGAVVSWLAQLRPAWWAIRGYALALLCGVMTSGGSLTSHLVVPDVFGTPILGLVTAGALVYASVEVGAGRLVLAGRWWPPLVRTASLVAGLVMIVVLLAGPPIRGGGIADAGVHEELDRLYEQTAVSARALTLPGGEAVTNIYAFDRDGTPLDGVLLYDGVGNPLVLQDLIDGRGFPFDTYGLATDYPRDRNGDVVPNLYPLPQYRTGGIEGETGLTPPAPEPDDGVRGPAADDDSAIVDDGVARPVPEVAIPPLEDPPSENPPPPASGQE